MIEPILNADLTFDQLPMNIQNSFNGRIAKHQPIEINRTSLLIGI